MSKIYDFFQNQPQGVQDLEKQQLALLMTLGQLPQDEILSEETLEAWSERKHPKRPAVRKLKKNRIYKALIEFHSQFGDNLDISYPYVLWVIGMCKRKTDVYLFHAHSIVVAKQKNQQTIDLDFWCTNVCQDRLWKTTEWKCRWKAQKTDEGNLLEQPEAWKEFHAIKFENEQIS